MACSTHYRSSRRRSSQPVSWHSAFSTQSHNLQ